MAVPFLDQATTIEVVNPEFRTVVENGSIEHLPDYLDQEGLASDHAFIITDTIVEALYGEAVTGTLSAAGIEPTIITMQAGEKNKTWETVGSFVERLSGQNTARSDTIIALGGGVVGDLGGFVASIYKRGIPLVHVPTTLLAMVDSSVGGKTGVDHGGKNMTGSFYQPRLVVADPTVLSTLSQRVYTEGFGEIAKYGMLDADFLPELEAVAGDLRIYSDEQASVLGQIIARCVKQKSDVIAADPFEDPENSSGRILLNYGHTLCHALEAAGGFTELLHGEGVSIGMNFAAKFAVALGFAEEELVERQADLLQSLGLPLLYEGEATVDEVMGHIAKDKKNLGSGETRFVFPQSPGQMLVRKIGNTTVETAVAEFLSAA